MLSVSRLILSFCLVNFVYFQRSSHGTNSSKICYYKYGCFSNEPPFDRDFSTLPLPPILINTHFKLFTQTSAHYDVLKPSDNETFYKSSFNPDHKTVIIIHGFNEYSEMSWIKQMTEELLKTEQMNIIVVDWYGSSVTKIYPLAVGNSRLVGAQVEELIVWICTCSRGTTAGDFHLIGFSLGAQVAGYTGRRLRKRGMILRRITGLDPANPGFAGKEPAVRLDPSDAAFVDIVHSDGRPLIGLGMYEPTGHVDFYPNGALTQPGCHGYFAVFDSLFQGGLVDSLHCNHIRAVELYITSIKNCCPMTAYQSKSWKDFRSGKFVPCHGKCVELGYHLSNKTANGSYYLHTTGKNPFCKRHYEMSVLIESWWLNPKVILSVQFYGEKGKSEMTTKSFVFQRNMKMIILSAGDIGMLKSLKISYQGYGNMSLRSVAVRSMWSDEIWYTCCNGFILKGSTPPKSYNLTVHSK